MPHTIAIAPILALLAAAEDVRGTVNDNIKHFRSLCYLVRLAQSNMPTPSDSPDATSDLEEILKLNMTVADKSWLKMFESEPTEKEWSKVEPTITNTGTKADWPTKWPKWLDTRHKMKQPKGPESWEKKHPRPQDFFQQQTAREQLKRISAAARTAESSIKTLKETQTNTDIKGLQDKLKEALCGQDVDSSTSPFTCKDNSAAGFSKTTSCTGNKVGKSIANDLACICTHNAHAGCVTGLDSTKLSGANLAANAMQDILAKCPALTLTPLNLANAIDTAAQTVASLLAEEHQTGKVFLGKDDNGGCNAAADSCVAYEEYYKATKLGFESIPWVTALRQAQQHYRDYLARENAKDLAAAKVAQMRVAAEAAYSAARITLQTQHPKAGLQGTGTPELTKQTKCKLKNSTAEECPSQHWDYDKEKEECKPRAGTENTAAETGDKKDGAAGTVKCSSHNDRANCEKENVGKTTPVCGWRKGKDGEGDKETEKCRNGSFLVNKKFTPMSAAFVSLVTLEIYDYCSILLNL
uniref:Variant surface glycoprotein 1125.529 n=1 Tax=Trypanosoma brucei TaxID=5691 RepID=A0A1J0R632_9TRYP|nr:variant surface glycoprotein 1125.529 [Trypanosoma brucei]